MNTLERFLHYVSFDTQSDPDSAASPTTEKQKLLAAALAEELRGLGLADAHMDGFGYVYAHLPATPALSSAPRRVAPSVTTSSSPANRAM